MLGLLADMGPSSASGGSGMMGPGMMMWGPSVNSGSGWMMGWPGGSLGWLWIILSWATWILFLVALVALIRWLWKKGNK